MVLALGFSVIGYFLYLTGYYLITYIQCNLFLKQPSYVSPKTLSPVGKGIDSGMLLPQPPYPSPAFVFDCEYNGYFWPFFYQNIENVKIKIQPCQKSSSYRDCYHFSCILKTGLQ